MSKNQRIILGLAVVLIVAVAVVGVIVARNNSHQAGIAQQQSPFAPAPGPETEPTRLSEGTAENSRPGEAAANPGPVSADTAPPAGDPAQQPKPGNAPEGGPPGMVQPADIAPILGLTAEELQSELQAGKTLEQVAGNQGITLDQLKEKWLAEKEKELNDQVSQGKLTAEQAQNMISRLQNTDLSKMGTGPEMNGAGPPAGSQQTPPPNANTQD